MKKQSNLSRPHAGKLSLNKKTISNLNSPEMSQLNGGLARTGYFQTCGRWCNGTYTQKQKTCPGHKTC